MHVDVDVHVYVYVYVRVFVDVILVVYCVLRAVLYHICSKNMRNSINKENKTG